MLSLNVRSPHDIDAHTQNVFSQDDVASIRNLKIAVQSIRRSLAEVETAISEIEQRSGALPAPSDPVEPSIPQVDPVIDRVEELRLGCEAILRRALRGHERSIVLSWALLERDGALVPTAEILELTQRSLSRPTPDGTLPSSLKWCDTTVQTLARASVAQMRGRAARNHAAELASLYEDMADRLESQEVKR